MTSTVFSRRSGPPPVGRKRTETVRFSTTEEIQRGMAIKAIELGFADEADLWEYLGAVFVFGAEGLKTLQANRVDDVANVLMGKG